MIIIPSFIAKTMSEMPFVNANLTIFLLSTVSYLIIFHIFFGMFIWSYWKTIGSKPAGPSKAVSRFFNPMNTPYFHVSDLVNIHIQKTVQYRTLFVALTPVFSSSDSSVCPEQRRNCTRERSEPRRNKRFLRRWRGIYPCIHARQEEVRLSLQLQNWLWLTSYFNSHQMLQSRPPGKTLLCNYVTVVTIALN